MRVLLSLLLILFSCSVYAEEPLSTGTGDLGAIIERNAGNVVIVSHTDHRVLKRVTGLGNLSHATIVFSKVGASGLFMITSISFLASSIPLMKAGL